MVTLSPQLWGAFQRTKLENKGTYQLNEVYGIAEEILNDTDSLLVVCNTKKEAESIFADFANSCHNVFYLSASLCMAHRKKVLEDIYASLKNKSVKTVCVSTQVIEAGVDISFSSVIRLAAGMDSVVQASGRCNRHGELKTGAPVYLINVSDENLNSLPDIKLGKDATLQLLEDFKTSPDTLGNDLTSNKAINHYYSCLYKSLSECATEYPFKGDTIFNLLAHNPNNFDSYSSDSFYLRQAFKSAGERFSVFDKDNMEVIVPYEKGAEIIAELTSSRALYDFKYTKQLIEEAKSYTVSLHGGVFDRLRKEKCITIIPDADIALLDQDYYDSNTGVSTKQLTFDFLEV